MRQFRTSTDSVFDLDTVLDHAAEPVVVAQGGPVVVAQGGPPAQETTGPQPDEP